MWAVTQSPATNGVDWLNLVYLLTATVIAAGVIVGSIRKMIRRVMEEVVDDRVKPHLEEDARNFTALTTQIAELRGQMRRTEL